jgi:hypothetical protein
MIYEKPEIKKSSDTFPLNQGQPMPSFVQFSQRVIYADKKALILPGLHFGFDPLPILHKHTRGLWTVKIGKFFLYILLYCCKIFCKKT